MKPLFFVVFFASFSGACGGEQVFPSPPPAASPPSKPAAPAPEPTPTPTPPVPPPPVDAAPPPAQAGQPCETPENPTLGCAEGLVCRKTVSIAGNAADPRSSDAGTLGAASLDADTFGAAGVCVQKQTP